MPSWLEAAVELLLGKIRGRLAQNLVGLAQMDGVTQQNAALVEEAAAAAESLQEQAQHLAGVVSVFKLGEQARQPAPAVATPVRAPQPAIRKTAPARQLAASKPATAKPAPGDDWEEF